MGISAALGIPALKPGVCTSTTRPAAPYEGQLLYETDTDSMVFWDGTIWANVATRKNLLYNGAMQVAQRGTSATGLNGTGYYTVDRWQQGASTGGTWTQTQEADAPTGSGFRNSLKMLCTTAQASLSAGSILYLTQALEGQDCQAIRKGTSQAQQVTLSFWVKSNVTGTYIVSLIDDDNTREAGKSYTVNASGTWEFKTLTFPADTTGALANDNGRSLMAFFWLAAGSNYTSGTLQTSWGSITNANRAVGQTNLASATNNYWQITGVQLNVGSTAAPFEHKSFGQELALCQRYFQRIGTNATDSGSAMYFFSGWIQGSGVMEGGFTFAPMRIGPTVTTSAASTFNVSAGSGFGVPQAISISQRAQTSIRVVVLLASGSYTNGHSGVFLAGTSQTAFFLLDSEL